MHNPAFERHPAGHALAAGDGYSSAQGRPKLGIRYHRLVARHVAVDLTLAY